MIYDKEPAKAGDVKPTTGDWAVMGATSVFAITATLLFSFLEEYEQLHLNLIFFCIVVVAMVMLCFDDPLMWTEAETSGALVKYLISLRAKYETTELAVGVRPFLLTWFFWLVYAHLLGANNYTSLAGVLFLVIKSTPVVMSWFVLFFNVLEMTPDVLHFVLLFLMAGVSILPHPSVMAPQIGVLHNGLRVTVATLAFVGTNALLYRRYTQNFRIRRNQRYIAPMLVLWVFFLPTPVLALIIVNTGVLLVREKTDHRVIAGDPVPLSDSNDFFQPQNPTKVDYDEDYAYDDAYDDLEPKPPHRTTRCSRIELTRFAGFSPESIASMNLHPADLAKLSEMQSASRSLPRSSSPSIHSASVSHIPQSTSDTEPDPAPRAARTRRLMLGRRA